MCIELLVWLILKGCLDKNTEFSSSDQVLDSRIEILNKFYVHGNVNPYNIVLVSNQWDATFVLLGLLSLYMFRTRFVSINTILMDTLTTLYPDSTYT